VLSDLTEFQQDAVDKFWPETAIPGAKGTVRQFLVSFLGKDVVSSAYLTRPHNKINSRNTIFPFWSGRAFYLFYANPTFAPNK